MLSEKDLIKRCVAGERKAQEELYKRYAPQMWGVCLRFTKNRMAAEDILQEGFVKVFYKLKQYNGEGSFEGWIRRTIVNTAINHHKKDSNINKDLDVDEIKEQNYIHPKIIDQLTINELMEVIREMPERYQLVFNLFVVEGYTHKEIGETLNITENTSKSQLSRARNLFQKLIKEKLNIDIDEA